MKPKLPRIVFTLIFLLTLVGIFPPFLFLASESSLLGSDPRSIVLAANPGDVVINEVQAYGDSANDDWIELYNPTSKDIDLAVGEYRIVKAAKTANWYIVMRIGNIVDGTYPGGTTIPAHDFYLIVRDDSDQALKGKANAIGTRSEFTWTGTGYTLYLGIGPISSDTDKDIVDKVGFGTAMYYESSPAPAIPNGQSIEREPAGVDTDNNFEDFVVRDIATPGEPGAELTPTPSATPTPVPTPTPVSIQPGDVVINEIAWMGTGASHNDEWLELYNTTNAEINLSGWTLYSLDGSPEIKLSGSIGAGGYFLLERTDDTTVNDIAADLIYTGALSNSGEHLRLIDASGQIVDEVDCSLGWFAGDNDSKTSMERLLPEKGGSLETNWMSNDGSKIFGKDANGGDISGTPKHENSVYGKEYLEDSTGDRKEVFEGDIAEIKDLELGTKVKVQGFVTAPPGIFGDDIFYIRDDSAGIKVDFDEVEDDDLELGDEVGLGCTIEESHDEFYIKMEEDDSFEILRTDLEEPEAEEVETGDIDEDLEGQLVKISGEIVETSGSTFWIDDGSGRAKIYVKDSTEIEVPYKRVGYLAEVVGIVSQWGELKDGSPNYRVMPRFQSDLEITKPEESSEEEEVLGEATGLPITSSRDFLALLGEVFLCLGLALRLTTCVILPDGLRSPRARFKTCHPEHKRRISRECGILRRAERFFPSLRSRTSLLRSSE